MYKRTKQKETTPETTPHLQCCFDGCPMNAWLKVRRPGGLWAIVCRSHYETLATQDAAEWCRHTPAPPPRRTPPTTRPREPGEDDD